MNCKKSRIRIRMNALPRKFYVNDTKQVAKDLLGKKLVRKIGSSILSGIIVETEAYKGRNDPASHAARKKTERNKIMFGEAGHAYVYFTYGMHYCFNVVAKKESDKSGAVLIRAIQPQQGIQLMIKNRKTDVIANLTNGPGKLAQAMQITLKQYNLDLTNSKSLFILDGKKPTKIIAKPRVGIKEGTDKLWNFSINNHL
jgi:DNA-3-methyladenine glycosylase